MFGVGSICSGLKDMVCDVAEKTLDTISEGFDKFAAVTETALDNTLEAADAFMDNTGLGDVISDVAFQAQELTEKAGEAMAHGYKAFTGELKYEEAKELLEEIEGKKKKAEESYKKYINQISKKINTHVEALNVHRKKLRETDFERFTSLVSMFSDWDIDPTLEEELTEIKEKKLNINLDKDDLFNGLDFDEHALRENCLAIITLGFLTRSKANQALEKVKQQESLIKEEIEKLESEKKRLKLIEKSLREAVSYFESFHGLYQKILSELEYSVNLLQGIYLLNKPFFFDDKVDPYFLPEKHLLCLMASEKMTRILHSMSKQRYISFNKDKKLNINQDEIKYVKNNKKVVAELQSALAVA